MSVHGEIDTPTLRAALVAIRVMADRRPWTPTTEEVAVYARLTHSGAYRLMARLSGPLELYQDEDGRWRRSD